MILLALLLPVVMMAFLFAADALEDLFFPPAVPDEAAPLSTAPNHHILTVFSDGVPDISDRVSFCLPRGTL